MGVLYINISVCSVEELTKIFIRYQSINQSINQSKSSLENNRKIFQNQNNLLFY